MNKIELTKNQLENLFKVNDFSFETTHQLPKLETMLGQTKALEVLEFGLNLHHKGYNIYAVSEAEEDFFKDIEKVIRNFAKSKSTPDDICYINNFKLPNSPEVIYLEAGLGKQFQDDMKEFSLFVKEELNQCVLKKSFLKQKNLLIAKQLYRKEKLINKLKKISQKLGCVLTIEEQQILISPIYKRKILTQEQVNNLPQKDKNYINNNMIKLAPYAEQVVKEIKKLEDNLEHHLDILVEEEVIKSANSMLKHLKNKYSTYQSVLQFFDDILENIIENLSVFIKDEVEPMESFLPIFNKETSADLAKKYEVNLLVNNENIEGSPVCVTDVLSVAKLIGKVDEVTDFTDIQAGLLHRVRGGFLILDAQDVAENMEVWLTIREVLLEGSLNLKNIISGATLNPQKISMPIKVIIVGNYQIYEVLSSYDKHFRELFQVKVEFEDEVDYTPKLVEQIGSKINYQCEEENLPPLTCEALLELIKYTQIRAKTSIKLSTDLTKLKSLVREASTFSKKYITIEEVGKVLEIHKVMRDRVLQNMKENYHNEVVMINVKDRKVGQVNGLAVYQIEDENFSCPIKITATTYKGKRGLINVEKVSGLSGNIHNKGVEIIEGFLGYHYAQEFEPNISCKICMEQNYTQVDGDSASAAELFAILSSLSNLSINQSIAVTGSVNQFGEIQPVGEVSKKIEGFYFACKELGRTMDQGVIIPYQNRNSLILCDEIIEAINKGQFHIYPIKNYVQGVELLMNATSKELDDKIFNKIEKFSVKK
ncbi:MAG: hypothetical protein ATN36_02455 [Epulopiscium sp. Nele67-Bin005]|nr:MAG: hypothetical protein ATN36_02455 [Epulopiscium sp. Nele67-Bin005]